MKKEYILLVFSIVIIILLIIILNYDNILKWRYNTAVKNKDCEKIYNIVDIEQGKYLTKEKYIEQCKLKINSYNNNDIKVENHKIKDDIVKVHTNITVYIPSDSRFYLDNELVSNVFSIDEKNIYNIFTFDKLFEGEYNIKFNNQTTEENNKITISQDGLKQIYEYNNEKQQVTIIGNKSCSFCTNLVNFLSTLDSNVFEVKYYDVYSNKEIERVKKEFLNYFKINAKFYPTVIIGNKYIAGYSDDMEKKYIESIYYFYRNKIETVIK